jgi:hypothetical protein
LRIEIDDWLAIAGFDIYVDTKTLSASRRGLTERGCRGQIPTDSSGLRDGNHVHSNEWEIPADSVKGPKAPSLIAKYVGRGTTYAINGIDEVVSE